MKQQERENLKKKLVSEIVRTKGFKTIACTNLGVNPRTFRQWVTDDAEFRQAVRDAVSIAGENRDDTAEKKLFDLVSAGDTTAVIFYAKTRLKDRGYSEKPRPNAVAPSPQPLELPVQADTKKEIERKVKSKRAYIVKLLNEQGKYTKELTYQVEITARLLVRADLLSNEILSDGHRPIHVEYSREGNERVTVDPKERLYLDVLEQSQKALRALGMNTESKERKTDNDSFDDFMKQMPGDL